MYRQHYSFSSPLPTRRCSAKTGEQMHLCSLFWKREEDRYLYNFNQSLLKVVRMRAEVFQNMVYTRGGRISHTTGSEGGEEGAREMVMKAVEEVIGEVVTYQSLWRGRGRVRDRERRVMLSRVGSWWVCYPMRSGDTRRLAAAREGCGA
ncbi:hypothetical protein E2C01_032735 [Portunus trituberculatus]|uniref:Uncharacterized protein n=1 Tax=Portunus trituberculatus TaxID=210409 RepID=A0A5B7F1S6_PORTR|nr:hypothetical protein [Portunus trituberculatus]